MWIPRIPTSPVSTHRRLPGSGERTRALTNGDRAQHSGDAKSPYYNGQTRYCRGNQCLASSRTAQFHSPNTQPPRPRARLPRLGHAPAAIRWDHLVLVIRIHVARAALVLHARRARLAGVLDDLPLDADEHPHPAAHELRELDPEDHHVPLRIRVQVARELRRPHQP